MLKSRNLLVFLIILKILLASTQKDNYTFLITGGYRPRQHALLKHMVSLQYKKPPLRYEKLNYNKFFGSLHFCGGTILTPRVILTAAHCLWIDKLGKPRNATTLKIIAKTPNRLKKTEHTEVLEVEEVIVHPNYDNYTLSNDIAILHLMSNINEDDVFAQSIELPDGPVEVGTRCTVLGWGHLFSRGPFAANALYADIYILQKYFCQHFYAAHSMFNVGDLCAGDPDDPEQNVCQGDSGGPMICNGKITGVVSHGYKCGELPVMFADVWYYHDWIYKFAKAGKSANNISIFKILLLLLLVWIVG